MKILFVADIFGRPGRTVVKRLLPDMIEAMKIDVCIGNCENSASGRGVTEKVAAELFNSGFDVLTGGNHLWDKREVYKYLEIEPRILKPANYPPKAIGNTIFYKNLTNGKKLAVLSLCGQVFMGTADSPFTIMEELLPILKKETNMIFVDLHAEATAEKRAFGLYFAGKISAVIGTHTHIQTADEEILPGGTAYITDAGMTGPHDSVIGVNKEIIFERMTTGMPFRAEVAESGRQLNAVAIEIDENTGAALSIERIRVKLD